MEFDSDKPLWPVRQCSSYLSSAGAVIAVLASDDPAENIVAASRLSGPQKATLVWTFDRKARHLAVFKELFTQMHFGQSCPWPGLPFCRNPVAVCTMIFLRRFAPSTQGSEIQKDQVRIARMTAKLSAIGFASLLLISIAKTPFAAEKLVTGYSSISPSELTLLTAAKAGLFEKYGLDVSTVYLGGSTRIIQAMVSGDVQIGQIGGSAVLFGKAAGVDVVYIATIINSMAAQIMSRPEIKQPSDLKGTAVGVTRRGSNTDYWARFGLSSSGLVPDKDVRILYTGGLRETYTALQQGQVSAAAMGLGNSFAQLLSRQNYNMLIDISKLGGDFPFNGVATTRRFLQSKRPVVVSFMKAYLEAIKVGLENKPLTKKILATHGGVTDEEILETAYDIYIQKIRSKVPYPVNRGWRTLIDFTARDNPKVRDVRIEEILDDGVIRELDESGFVKSLGLK